MDIKAVKSIVIETLIDVGVIDRNVIPLELLPFVRPPPIVDEPDPILIE